MVARGHQSTDPRVARRRERTGLRFPRWTQKRQLQGGHPNPLTRPPGDGAAANTARVCADEGLGGTREGRSPSSSSPYRCWDQLSVVSWQVAPNPGNRGAKSTEFVWGKGAPTRSPNKPPTKDDPKVCAPTDLAGHEPRQPAQAAQAAQAPGRPQEACASLLPYGCWDQLSVVSWQVAPNPGNRGAKSTEFVWGKGAPTRSPNKLPTQATRELCAPTNLGPPRAQTQQNRPHMALQRSAHPPTWPTTSPGTLGRARQAGTVAGKPVRTHAPGGGGV
jgi:hypothetical protein